VSAIVLARVDQELTTKKASRTGGHGRRGKRRVRKRRGTETTVKSSEGAERESAAILRTNGTA